MMPVGVPVGDGVEPLGTGFSGFFVRKKSRKTPSPMAQARDGMKKRFPNGNLFLKIKNKLRNKNIF